MEFLKTIKKALRAKRLPSYLPIREMMSRYQVKDLVGVSPEAFRSRIDEFLALHDAGMEGFADAERQRDLSVKFHWGHDHDFGSFSLKGRMADRHIQLLSIFRDEFHALPESLAGMKVLDIGCWTGGTSLLLSAMGAEVVAIEEVKKYTDALAYLKQSFGIKKLEIKNLSLYECNSADFQDAFDLVLFAGVLYHISDPIVALRIVFNSLKDGGSCLLETMSTRSSKPVLDYWGPDSFALGEKTKLNRAGWNWFVPSPPTLKQMMTDVGFEEVRVRTKADRSFAVGKRARHVDIMRAGLSVRTIR